MKEYTVAIVPGDGIGPEIIPAAMKVLEAVAAKNGFSLRTEVFPWGAGHYKNCGRFMPPDGLEILRNFDAILFGAVGLPEVDDTLPARHFTFKVRKGFQQYVNLRPVRLLPGVPCPLRGKQPEDIDFVIIRENTEGEFVQAGSVIHPEAPTGLALDTSVFTRHGIERVAQYAFRLARTRRKKVTNVTKSNTIIHTLAYWDRVVGEVSAQYPDVHYSTMYVDNAAASFVLHPESFDVVLTTNFIGDILSDLGGSIMGSLGLAPSGNINPEGEYPSMFEPIHGSAPDIAGKGIANPIGAIWSGALMLDHLGSRQAAAQVLRAIERAVARRALPRDLGGSHSTVAVADAVVRSL